MATARRYTAIITARGGSKGLPGKNLARLGGRPLIEYTIEAARQCALVERTLVSTDDEAIAKASVAAGAEVLERPAELATDTASSVDTVAHVLRVLAAQGAAPVHFVLLQPTSPLRTARMLTECLALLEGDAGGCAVSVCDADHHPAKTLVQREGRWEPLLGDWEVMHQPRQALPRTCRPNGAIYAMATADFMLRRQFVFEPLVPYFMSTADSIDIDSAEDLRNAERQLLVRQAGA
jgi:CMP-N,N'-diacetyllegionaminic acid synthase